MIRHIRSKICLFEWSMIVYVKSHWVTALLSTKIICLCMSRTLCLYVQLDLVRIRGVCFLPSFLPPFPFSLPPPSLPLPFFPSKLLVIQVIPILSGFTDVMSHVMWAKNLCYLSGFGWVMDHWLKGKRILAFSEVAYRKRALRQKDLGECPYVC